MKMMHITIQTKKFDEEINFYKDCIELSIKRDLRTIGRNIVFLGNDEDSTLIEIIENVNATETEYENISIGFNCADIENKREQLMKSGIDVTHILSPLPNVKFFFAMDPAGVKVQFIQ